MFVSGARPPATTLGASSSAAVVNRFRSPKKSGKVNLQQQSATRMNTTHYEDTPKIDELKLAQQGNVEIPAVVMRMNSKPMAQI